jgi:hypothetical protein
MLITCVKYGTLTSNPSSEIMRSLFDFCKVAIAITVTRGLWVIAPTIYLLKAIAIIVSRDF